MNRAESLADEIMPDIEQEFGELTPRERDLARRAAILCSLESSELIVQFLKHEKKITPLAREVRQFILEEVH